MTFEITCTEKDVENHFCDIASKQFDLRIIGQQIQLKCGVLDVLAYHRSSKTYFVVELKKEEIKPDTLAQAMTYCLELNAKAGKSKFFPLLIGSKIRSGYLDNCLFNFTRDFEAEEFKFGIPYLTYGFDPNQGVKFTWSYRHIQENVDFKEGLFEERELHLDMFGRTS